MTKPYAIYVRQSLDRTGAGLAIKRQTEDCRVLALRSGLSGEGVVYSDNDVSATRSRRRKQYEALLDALRRGEHDTLLVWHNDRLHRRPAELEEFISIAEACELRIETVQAGLFDLSTPTGRMIARYVGASARYEIEHKGARRARSNLQRAQAGERATGGTRGFGYGRTEIASGVMRHVEHDQLNETEAKAIRNAARRLCVGESSTSIWRSWNAAGLFTPLGREWEGSTFRRTMRRPALAGLVTYRGQVLNGVRGQWPAILSMKQLAGVDAVFAEPGRKRYNGTSPRQLLDRIAICFTCGAPMRVLLNRARRRADGTTRGFPTYRCPNQHCSITVQRLDPIVQDAVVAELATSRRDLSAVDSSNAQVMDRQLELVQIAKREQRVVEAIADGLIDQRMADAALRRVAADRARVSATAAFTKPRTATLPELEVEARIAAERFIRALPGAVVREWPTYFSAAHPDLETGVLRWKIHDGFEELPLATRRALVRATVRVVISRGKEASRVQIRPA